MPVYPEQEYLESIGRCAYGISSIEWLLLGDLPRLNTESSNLSLEKLNGLSTGQIAQTVRNEVEKVSDPETQAYIKACGEALGVLARKRNDILHARPATIDGQQRLFRWAPGRSNSKPHAITLDILKDLEALIQQTSRHLNSLRPEIS